MKYSLGKIYLFKYGVLKPKFSQKHLLFYILWANTTHIYMSNNNIGIKHFHTFFNYCLTWSIVIDS